MAAPLVIAIDGPAASGKGTLARRIAEAYGLPHLDTGLLYRAVGARCLADGVLENEAASIAAARMLDLSTLDADSLRGAETGAAASVVAARPGVRAALLDLQRSFAAQPGGAVLDGRDIGTVICPDAAAKLFVTASAEERAVRRFRELSARGAPQSLAEVLADIKARDARDSGRSAAPLVQAEDAVLLDTTDLGIEAATEAALAIIRSRLGAR
ncbi:MAG: cytidylate kinase [Rhizobiales bacterium 17-65-6]|nr:MAG: cytidylate kinase [Azorhizobium sp. 32-67-21]OYZ98868.1 MAG: cytidylate kinase [Rhizobiales bacterium 17-65-6]